MMAAKYNKGQKVRVVSLQNQYLHIKYPKLNSYVSKVGIVLESYWVGLEMQGLPRDHYIYSVDINGNEITIPEDALEPAD